MTQFRVSILKAAGYFVEEAKGKINQQDSGWILNSMLIEGIMFVCS